MRSVAWIIFCCLWLNGITQIPVKKSLKIEDFSRWNTLSNSIISNDGHAIAFSQNPQKGDGMLIIKQDRGNFDTIPRGSNVRFGPENNFAVFDIKQPEEHIRNAKLKKIKKENMPKDSLGIIVFTKPYSYHKFPGATSYKIPEENAQWIAFSMEPRTEVKDSSLTGSDKNEKNKKDNSLVMFQVSTADTLMFPNVSEWIYSENGTFVWFRRQVKDSTGMISSVYCFNTLTGEAKGVFSEKGWIEQLAADETGRQCAFLFSGDTISEKKYALFAGTADTEPKKIVDEYTSGMPIGWCPGKDGNLYFSKDGTRLFLGTAVTPAPEPKDTLLDEEKPKLDIWSWHDKKIQPQQLVELSREKKRTYPAVYHLNQKRFVQLANPQIREVSTILDGNGDLALGYNDSPYIREASWTGNFNRDYYLVDLVSGDKWKIVENKSYVRISPLGKFVIWYDVSDKGYYARSTDTTQNDCFPLTQMLPVNFYNEMDDRPTDPSPYGIAGWSDDDKFVYIYDRYDIWRIDLTGHLHPECITNTFGRKNSIRLRYLKLDPDEKHIPSGEEVILRAFNDQTMENGFFGTRVDITGDPRLLLMDTCHFSGLRKAKKSKKLIWSRENVTEYPDLWCSDVDFSNAEKISNANPQQEDFFWPEVRMVEWMSFSGEKLKGLLYLPENLNPSDKYPMVVYFYERNSENLYRHQYPSPSRSTINKTFYASNGYVVFIPDITYKEGYPGQSAYNAIVSGTQYLLNALPFIDETKVGIQGQSWGGYQVAYLITQTDMFAAAMAGAPVSNMTSAYGGIRWQSGLVRMFQYERQQSRIGGSLWEKPFQYIENSPLFAAPKINTPLLMMHNDKDGAVPWTQGIEFFAALRRLDKPVWLLNYNNEPHNLNASSWANRVDLSTRMFQFFNHYLKGHSMPEWMEKGIPAVAKGEDYGY